MQQFDVGEDRAQLLDLGAQLVGFLLEFEAAELRQAAQLQVENVRRLRLGQVEHLHEARPRRRGVVGGADDLDDLVDVEDRDEQAVDEVEAVLLLAEAVRGASAHDVDAEVRVDAQQLLEPEGARLAVDECDVVDAEALLHRRQLVELLEYRFGVEAVLQFDDEAQAVVAVGQVLDVGDALQFLLPDEVFHLVDDLLGPDEVRQFGDDDALAARRDVLDGRRRARAERTAAGEVGVADAVEADDAPAHRQVGARHEAHEVVEAAVGVLDEVDRGLHDLAEVVRRHVRRHADGDAARAVDEQVRERGGQDGRLLQRVVVVGHEVDGVLVEAGHERQRCGRETRLGVTRRRGALVERAEVAMAVDQRQAHREVLRHAHERVVDRRVAVRVVLAHDLADDARGLDVVLVRRQAEFVHREQDAPLHRLEPVTRVGKGTRVDDGVAVLEESRPHLVLDIDVDDVLDDVLVRHLGLLRACHCASSLAR